MIDRKADEPTRRTCGTWEAHLRYLRELRGYQERYLASQRLINAYLHRTPDAGLRSGIVVIPLVVHVLWNTGAQNIPDAQVQSQITVLNQDYRMLNPDVGGTPAAFAPVVADARIQFQLARRDPNCQATTGITHTQTTVAQFDIFGSDAMKATATGGIDPWAADRYLNIWVVNGQSGQLGRATFPGTPANIDGVIVSFQAFGTIGSLFSAFNLGRTATHEIGHYFDLHHVWGDVTGCGGTDFVADTPTQNTPNFGCPTFPHISCNNGPNGDIFMDFMDYTDDACMFMFTAGQSARMEAALMGARASLLASDALVPPPAPAVAVLWSADTPQDVGDEPDTLSAVIWESDDIWVRNQNDGITNQEHQNPIYDSTGTVKNYVYVRVRNRSCAAAGNGTLKGYWAKASTALSWPAPFDGSVNSPALMGGLIGSQPTGSVPGRGSSILAFQWDPPDLANYSSFGADQNHFCLLSRVETANSPPYGMTFPEGSNLGANVANNNKIAWKNLEVVSSGGRAASFTISNFGERVGKFSITVSIPRLEHPPAGYELELEFDRKLAERLSEVVHLTKDRRLHLKKLGDRIGPFTLGPKEHHSIVMHLHQAEGPSVGVVRAFDVAQFDHGDATPRRMGGQRIVFKLRARPHPLPSPYLHKRWLHSHEEDNELVEVFRAEGYDFPPSRGRRGFELREDGSATFYEIAPADGHQVQEGSWLAQQEDRLSILFADPDRHDQDLEIVSLEEDRLAIAKT